MSSFGQTICMYCLLPMTSGSQSSRWEPVLQPKTSKTLLELVNFSVFFKNYIKIKPRIWFGPVKSNFHFGLWDYCIFLSFYFFLINPYQLFQSWYVTREYQNIKFTWPIKPQDQECWVEYAYRVQHHIYSRL